MENTNNEEIETTQKTEEVVDENVQEKIAESEDNKKKNKKEAIFREVCSWIAVVGFAIVAAYLINTFVIVNANVPTGSMENTIKEKSRIIGLRFAYWFDEPDRLDIIIFKAPDEPNKNYVKRVIGLPGEKVRIEDAKIYITPADGGEEFELEEDYLKEKWVVMAGPFEYEVPEDSYFVLGDNRNGSKDARYWVNKFVPEDDILGQAVICYSPKIYKLK